MDAVRIQQNGSYLRRCSMRKNAKHIRFVDWKYFRIYYSGSYAWLEIDFGRIGHGEFVIVLGCIDKLVDWTYYKPHWKEVAY